jgi:hypothetical protein
MLCIINQEDAILTVAGQADGGALTAHPKGEAGGHDSRTARNQRIRRDIEGENFGQLQALLFEIQVGYHFWLSLAYSYVSDNLLGCSGLFGTSSGGLPKLRILLILHRCIIRELGFCASGHDPSPSESMPLRFLAAGRG